MAGKKRLVVRRAFGYKGVYYTNDNIDKAPKDVIEKQLKSGAVVEVVEPAAKSAEPLK